ncbi:MAG: BatD family protein [Elusimicrobia bacterium]|nr:BatD family protein [Elusimicrobiota bacterium]
MKRLLSILFCSFFVTGMLTPAPLMAADISISAAVDQNVISLDEQLVLELNVSGGKADLPSSLPDIPNFTVQSSGRSENISIINGSMSSSTSLRFTLVPHEAGKFTIPSISMTAKGKTYQTQPIAVEVTAAGAASVQRSAPARTVTAPSSAGASDGRPLYITASLDKATAYVNEKIVYTFRFFRRVNLLSNPNYSPANFSGFWKEDLPPKNYQTVINGQRYSVNELQILLFPTRPGLFNLGSAGLQCQVEDINQADPFAGFAGFFSGGRTQQLTTNVVSVKVLALPETGKPKDFNGTVGQFNVSAALDKRSAKVNEPVTLSITVAGTGSIKTIADPKLPDWTDFRKYETVNTTAMDAKNDTVSGSKIFKTVIVPLTPGKKTIQSIPFSFFDPAAQQYRTMATAPLTIDIAPGDPSAAPISYSPQQPAGAAPANIALVTTDIRYIKPLASWCAYRGPLYRRWPFIIVNIFPLLVLAGVFVFLRWSHKLSTDVAFARKMRASKTARKYLASAQKILTAGNTTPSSVIDFYTAVSRALLEFIGHKLNVSPEGLTNNALADMLLRRAIAATIIETTKTILDECDLVRFAPTTVTAAMMRAIYNQTAAVIEDLDKKL